MKFWNIVLCKRIGNLLKESIDAMNDNLQLSCVISDLEQVFDNSCLASLDLTQQINIGYELITQRFAALL